MTKREKTLLIILPIIIIIGFIAYQVIQIMFGNSTILHDFNKPSSKLIKEESSLILTNIPSIKVADPVYSCYEKKASIECSVVVESGIETSRTIVEDYIKNAEKVQTRLEENGWQKDTVSFRGTAINITAPNYVEVNLVYEKKSGDLNCTFDYHAYDLAAIPDATIPTQAFYKFSCYY